eukprot:366421-Chlamydomonas_euryale.AAC.22
MARATVEELRGWALGLALLVGDHCREGGSRKGKGLGEGVFYSRRPSLVHVHMMAGRPSWTPPLAGCQCASAHPAQRIQSHTHRRTSILTWRPASLQVLLQAASLKRCRCCRKLGRSISTSDLRIAAVRSKRPGRGHVQGTRIRRRGRGRMGGVRHRRRGRGRMGCVRIRRGGSWPDGWCENQKGGSWPDGRCENQKEGSRPDGCCENLKEGSWPDERCEKQKKGSWPDGRCENQKGGVEREKGRDVHTTYCYGHQLGHHGVLVVCLAPGPSGTWSEIRYETTPARRSGCGQPNIHTRLAGDDKSLSVIPFARRSDDMAADRAFQARYIVQPNDARHTRTSTRTDTHLAGGTAGSPVLGRGGGPRVASRLKRRSASDTCWRSACTACAAAASAAAAAALRRESASGVIRLVGRLGRVGRGQVGKGRVGRGGASSCAEEGRCARTGALLLLRHDSGCLVLVRMSCTLVGAALLLTHVCKLLLQDASNVDNAEDVRGGSGAAAQSVKNSKDML